MAWPFPLVFRLNQEQACAFPRRAERQPEHCTRFAPWDGDPVGDCPRSFPSHPCHRKRCPFQEQDGSRLAEPTGAVSVSSGSGVLWTCKGCPRDRWARTCCHLGPRGIGQACLLPRLLSQSEARAPALDIASCVLSSQASVSPQRERVTPVLPPARCSSKSWLSYLTSVSRLQCQELPCAPGAVCPALPRQAPGTLVTGLSLSLRLLPQLPTRFSLGQKGFPGKDGSF